MNIGNGNRSFNHGSYLDSANLSKGDIELLKEARHYWNASDSYHFGECAYEYLVGKLSLDDDDEIAIRQFLNTVSNGEMPIRRSSLLDRFMNGVTLAAVAEPEAAKVRPRSATSVVVLDAVAVPEKVNVTGTSSTASSGVELAAVAVPDIS